MDEPIPRMSPYVRYNNSSFCMKAVAIRPIVARTAPMTAVGRIPKRSLNMLDTVHIKNVTPVHVDPTNAEK